jgi:hypothetical protein
MALVDWTDMAQKKVSYIGTPQTCEFNYIKQGQEVNPVEIWEGIDTHEDTGCNHLTK